MNTLGYPGAAILPAIQNIQATALGILVPYCWRLYLIQIPSHGYICSALQQGIPNAQVPVVRYMYSTGATVGILYSPLSGYTYLQKFIPGCPYAGYTHSQELAHGSPCAALL